MICDRCGMYSPERMVDGSEPPVHECPEPYPYDVALSFVQYAESAAARGGALIVSPRQKARIHLGLKAGPTSSRWENNARPTQGEAS